MISVDLKNAGLTFRVRPHGRTTLKEAILRGLFRGAAKTWMEINALKNMTLHIPEGERLGLVGHNGAGKSTFLKVMTGVYPVTAGEVSVKGHVHSLLDISVGVEPDANGWENIKYRCLLQGDTPLETRDKAEAIADFSELGDAMNMPVKFYSSGMLVRLLFSIATTIEPEILLMDEILGAGDASFQEKAHRRMMDLVERAGILIIASHDLATLSRLCTRTLWLDHGTIVMDAKPNVVIPAYEDFMRQAAEAA
jgi:ABC-type polysaccharide/polyol phosphate transport system ATPase subunit